jgi:Uma2 family endonuclease
MRRETPEELVCTYKDLEDLPEDPRFRQEIIDGELFLTPSPIPLHQRVLLNLVWILEGHVRKKKIGEILFAPVDIYFTETNVLEPDLVFWRNERRSIVKEKFLEGAPDLVVEILSKGTAQRDRVTKKAIYERFSVPHYWILDPFSKTLVELVLRRKKLHERTKFSGKKTFSPACFPGLKIPLGKVFSP